MIKIRLTEKHAKLLKYFEKDIKKAGAKAVRPILFFLRISMCSLRHIR